MALENPFVVRQAHHERILERILTARPSASLGLTVWALNDFAVVVEGWPRPLRFPIWVSQFPRKLECVQYCPRRVVRSYVDLDSRFRGDDE